MKKLYENILHDKNVIKEIFSLMKENSILKEYYKFEIEYSFCTGKVIQKKKEERRKINYTYFVNGIDYSQSFYEIYSIKKLKELLQKTENNNGKIERFEFVGNWDARSIGIEDVIEIGQAISKIFNKYLITIYLTDYIEVLVLSNGKCEKRVINFFCLGIKQQEVEIGTLFFDKYEKLNNIISQIEQLLCNYEKWYELPKIDFNSLKCNKIECVMKDTASANIFHEAIGHLSERDIFEKINPQYIKINEIISHKELNIFDIPYSTDVSTNIIFDDYGKETKETKIVEQGKLVGIMDDGIDEKEKEGYFVNGYLRGSLDADIINIRMRNLMVSNGTSCLDDSVRKINEILYVEKIDDSYLEEEKIILYIKRATILEQGSAIARLENIVLESNVFDFLKNIKEIYNDGKWKKCFRCTKNNATIYISSFSPSILCMVNIKK